MLRLALATMVGLGLVTLASTAVAQGTGGSTSDPMVKYRCPGYTNLRVVHGLRKTRIRDFATRTLLFVSTRTAPQPTSGKCFQIPVSQDDNAGRHGLGQSTVKALHCTFPTRAIIWYQHGVEANGVTNTARTWIGYQHDFYASDRQSPDPNTSYDDQRCKVIP